MKKWYTVIGIWDLTEERYADSFEAESPEDAEDMAIGSVSPDEDGCGLLIAGVVEGQVDMAS